MGGCYPLFCWRRSRPPGVLVSTGQLCEGTTLSTAGQGGQAMTCQRLAKGRVCFRGADTVEREICLVPRHGATV